MVCGDDVVEGVEPSPLPLRWLALVFIRVDYIVYNKEVVVLWVSFIKNQNLSDKLFYLLKPIIIIHLILFSGSTSVQHAIRFIALQMKLVHVWHDIWPLLHGSSQTVLQGRHLRSHKVRMNIICYNYIRGHYQSLVYQ